MKWINEMIEKMEKDRAAAPADTGTKEDKVDRTEHPRAGPGALKAWNALVSAIANDVNDFNIHRKRAGHTVVRMSQRDFECQVHLSGMQGKTLVLTFDNNSIRVSVHPDFPTQQLTITLELDEESQAFFWVLGEATKERTKLTDQQLSEYLLKPILSSAAINS